MPAPFQVNRGYYQEDTLGLADTANVEIGWHVIWTRSNCERIVRDQLQARSYDAFLPMVDEWSVRGRGRKTHGKPLRKVPMFRGYLFVRHGIDKSAFLEISNTRGVSRLLGARWDRLARVPETQVHAIQRVAECDLPQTPYPYLKKGARVRITRGPLVNAEGVLVRTDQHKGLFVVSVSLLQRSVAVKVDCHDVEPV